jgi:O-antigen ligase
MRSPELGLAGTLLLGLIVPYYGPSGFNLTMAGIGLLLGLWFAEMFIIDQKLQLGASRLNLPVASLLLIAILAFVVGRLAWFRVSAAPLQAQLGGVAIYVLSAGALWVAGNRVRSERWLEILSWSFVALAWLRILGWLVPAIGRLFTEHLFVAGSLGSLFYVWMASILVAHLLFNRQLSRWMQVLFALLALGQMYVCVVLNYEWKSGWLPPLISVAVLLALRFGRLAPLMALSAVPVLLRMMTNAVASDDYSYSTRLDAWSIVLEIAKANPITGLGPSNYYWYTPLYSIRGYHVNFNSHSQYVDLIAQTGIIGLLVFLWVMASVALLAWRLRHVVSEGFARGYVYAVLAGTCGSFVAAWLGDWVLPFVYNVGLAGFRASVLFWVFAGGLIYYERRYP